MRRALSLALLALLLAACTTPAQLCVGSCSQINPAADKP